MMNNGLTNLLAFLGVIAFIPLALWLLKRSTLMGGAPQGTMRVIATLAVAPHQKLLTVEVGHGDDCRWLIVGITAAGMCTLHTMTPQAEVVSSTLAVATPKNPFASLLAKHVMPRAVAATSPATHHAP